MAIDFINGKGIDELSKKFQCAKSTIIRNLKNNLDSKEYNFLIIKNKNENKADITSNQGEFKIIDYLNLDFCNQYKYF